MNTMKLMYNNYEEARKHLTEEPKGDCKGFKTYCKCKKCWHTLLYMSCYRISKCLEKIGWRLLKDPNNDFRMGKKINESTGIMIDLITFKVIGIKGKEKKELNWNKLALKLKDEYQEKINEPLFIPIF